MQIANIAKSESRGKACFDYAERQRLYEPWLKLAKSESRGKACFDYAERQRLYEPWLKYKKVFRRKTAEYSF